VRLFIFGFGFSGEALARTVIAEGWRVSATVRREETRTMAKALGVAPIDPADPQALAAAAADADAVLITAAPGEAGCPGFTALTPILAAGASRPRWIGYLSTTGVYGDRAGRWVFETSAVNPQSMEGARRAAAEGDWLALGRQAGLAVAVFRLPGIYGPGRSPFDRLRDGTARRLVKPGHVFSRIHVEDLAAGLVASMLKPRHGGVYNLCDDEPVSATTVTEHAAHLLGLPAPPQVGFDPATASPALLRFYAECKRVSNAQAKAELGWRPAYPSYREGLGAILDAESVT
jgi:nucleoside-diphosphate-sugar epimerase